MWSPARFSSVLQSKQRLNLQICSWKKSGKPHIRAVDLNLTEVLEFLSTTGKIKVIVKSRFKKLVTIISHSKQKLTYLSVAAWKTKTKAEFGCVKRLMFVLELFNPYFRVKAHFDQYKIYTTR